MYQIKIVNMKFIHGFSSIRFIVRLFPAMLFFFFTLALRGQDDCDVTKSHGSGYTTTIASVAPDGEGGYDITLIVTHNGCGGNSCRALSSYAVQAAPGTYSDISVEVLSGQMTYRMINMGPTLPGSGFQGFRIEPIGGIGFGIAGSFAVSYSISGPLQNQIAQTRLLNTNKNVSFTAAEFESVMICGGENISPYYPPPDDGKNFDLIGAELTSLYEVYINSGSYISDDIFQIVGDNVLIEVHPLAGMYDQARAVIAGPGYGMTEITDDPQQDLFSGLFPVVNLLSINLLPDLISFVRPVYPALGNAGIVTSQGDIALRTDLSREAFGISGAGVKIGVLSDSYNTLPGDPAADDVTRGDLPGAANPDHPLPVQVLRDYPYGPRSDEGRAMLQILHDVAPGASLAFRTGFLGAADFAKGILELQQQGCDIIVDDITYISEPFFRDGIVARAVDSAAALGVTYFSAAGNYGSKSYQAGFAPAATPPGISGEAHNFAALAGGTDIYQNISLTEGNYTLVLQWDDGTPGNTTASDFDIYLTKDNGTTLFGFNRVNTGGAPAEILPFTVIGDVAQTNIMIVRASGSGPALLKYIIFRGNATINEYATPEGSTLVGQANAQGAIAVGAVLYSNTPEYGVNPPTVASFSSRGGTPVDGIDRLKPEICAPNGVNTTVDLGGVNIDGDLFPNFFGTSAAAPHAAALAALLLEARQKFYGSGLSPEGVRSAFLAGAIDMHAPGYDAASGAGYVQADSLLLALAHGKPLITGIAYDTTLTPGEEPVELSVFGRFLNGESKIWFDGQPLDSATVLIGDTVIRAVIPVFDQLYPAIQVFNPPMEGTNGLDGGLSNALYFTTKETILINIDDQAKKYGEVLPAFSATYSLEGVNGSVPLDSAGLTQDEIDRIHSIPLVTLANSLSNTGTWAIEPGADDPLSPLSSLPALDSLDLALLERFQFGYETGFLTIQNLDLVISPRDTAFVYGEDIGGFHYDFSFGGPGSGLMIETGDSLALLSAMKLGYATALVNETALVDATALVNAQGEPLLDATALVNKSFMISNAMRLGYATALVNGTLIEAEPLYNATALVNAVTKQNNTALVPATALVNGTALVNTYDPDGVLINAIQLGYATALVNTLATALVNSGTINANSNSDAIVILGDGDISILSGDSSGTVDLRSINLITGNTVGQHLVVPGSFIANNFNISYGLGVLTILPDTAQVIAADRVIDAGNPLPSFTATFDGFNEGDDESVVTSLDFSVTPAYGGAAGVYDIIPSALADNYVFTPVNGTLYVNPAGPGTVPVNVFIECVEHLSTPDSSGFNYIAHFGYANANATPVFVPAGADNYFSGSGTYNPIQQPDLFLPGGGSFSVPFDGQFLSWGVRSNNTAGQKSLSLTRASIYSPQCVKSAEAESNTHNEQPEEDILVYPNPTGGNIWIETGRAALGEEDIMVLDAYGRSLSVRPSRSADGQYGLDLSDRPAGLYFIRIIDGISVSVFRIIKR